MLSDMDREELAPVELRCGFPHPKNPEDFSTSPQGGGEEDAKNLASDGHPVGGKRLQVLRGPNDAVEPDAFPVVLQAAGRREGESRVAFRDGERAGELEILSFDARGACTVHRVGGLALANLLVKAAEAQRRGMA
ncbi:MAG: hypothetical protein U0942_15980 [Parvibaculum sp.]|uniref:hypothetical protein n=1 Tax=Parvibaculum sp. TaxID=2024848 RepID=UPI002AB83A85|nr:hypothetical protein [Parvibaculum sp.]MDZ4382831.1 hypothetical protein [Parvibaculum sp.]